MPDKPVPMRRGIAKCLTIEHDAVPLLAELAAGQRSQGHLVSELLRQEATRREERAKGRHTRQQEGQAE